MRIAAVPHPSPLENHLSAYIIAHAKEEFAPLGLKVSNFVIENLSLPEDVEKMLDERTGYIIFPECNLDATTGHLSATGGKGVNFTVNANGHLESEVM